MEMLYKFLMEKHAEIRLQESQEDKEAEIMEAYDLIKELAYVARKEGLLALEERVENLDTHDVPVELFAGLLMMIVDGNEPKLVTEIGLNRLISDNLPAYDGLRSFMFYQCSLLIQAGENPVTIDRYLQSMLPLSVRNKLKKRESENKPSVKMKTEQDENLLRKLCEDNKTLDENDYSIVNQTALTFIAASDKSMQRLLREIDSTCVAVALKVMPGKARKRVFDNVSTRLGILLAEDMAYMGPIRMSDAEKVCHDILKKIVKLSDSGEIAGLDTTVLKIVLDIYDSAQKRNRELKEQYKDVKNLIEKIYGAGDSGR